MKKNLLSLALILSAGIYTYAQDTYINDAVTVKVNPNTLFFHGGNVSITNTSGDTKKIINDGNIQIKGNFTNTSTSGKNFVNTYTAPDTNVNLNYGQLIIKEDQNISGSISMERNKLDTRNSYYGIGLPFSNENSIKEVINNMLNSTTAFKGDCPVNTPCGQRYNQTILLWDIQNTEYDAVGNSDKVVPGGNYTIKLGTSEIGQLINSIGNDLTLYGTPNNKPFNLQRQESGIKGVSKPTFSEYQWSAWKNRQNNYNETYLSYLGDIYNQTSKIYGKNLHRFSNPFTSNIDLSAVNTPSNATPDRPVSWISFNVTRNEQAESIEYPTQIWDILGFKISKIPNNLVVLWNQQVGGSNIIEGGGNKRVSAYLDKATNSSSTPYFWTGSPEALIIQPFEYFEVEYFSMSPSLMGNNRIISANYNITDDQKTFKYSFDDEFDNTDGVYARNSNNLNSLLNNKNLQNRGLIGPNDFTQLELYLTKNNSIEDEAAYLVNSSFYTSGNQSSSNQLSENKLFLYEENSNGTIARNSQTLLNKFKNDFVGKPLAIGFNNLNLGETYIIKLRLFEYSILNKVNSFNNGTYYLLDKYTNQVSEINGDSTISFIADENINNRFEFYWNEVPRTLATDDLKSKNQTFVYDNQKEKFIRFEQNNTKADIKIIDLTGRIISTYLGISTSQDYKLITNNTPSIYIVHITYEDGTIITKKVINN